MYQWCGPAARVKAVAFGSAQAFALLTNGTALVVGGCEAAAGGDAPRHLPAVCTAWWGVIAITLLNLVGLALTRAFVYVLMPKLYHKLLLVRRECALRMPAAAPPFDAGLCEQAGMEQPIG